MCDQSIGSTCSHGRVISPLDLPVAMYMWSVHLYLPVAMDMWSVHLDLPVAMDVWSVQLHNESNTDTYFDMLVFYFGISELAGLSTEKHNLHSWTHFSDVDLKSKNTFIKKITEKQPMCKPSTHCKTSSWHHWAGVWGCRLYFSVAVGDHANLTYRCTELKLDESVW